jgi:hypothetical protein
MHFGKSIPIFQRVLNMGYNTKDYWIFGLCPSYGILKDTPTCTAGKDLVYVLPLGS